MFDLTVLHFLADWPLQSKWISQNLCNFRKVTILGWTFNYSFHALLHATIYASAIYFGSLLIGINITPFGAILIGISHYVIDYYKECKKAFGEWENEKDQGLHLGVLFIINILRLAGVPL